MTDAEDREETKECLFTVKTVIPTRMKSDHLIDDFVDDIGLWIWIVEDVLLRAAITLRLNAHDVRFLRATSEKEKVRCF